MVTLEKAKELYGELPKDVLEDPYYQKEFLVLLDDVIKSHGEAWVKEHRSHVAVPMGICPNVSLR